MHRRDRKQQNTNAATEQRGKLCLTYRYLLLSTKLVNYVDKSRPTAVPEAYHETYAQAYGAIQANNCIILLEKLCKTQGQSIVNGLEHSQQTFDVGKLASWYGPTGRRLLRPSYSV